MVALINKLFRGSRPMSAMFAASRSQASIPGRIEPEYVAWARCFPGKVVLGNVLIVVLLGLGISGTLLVGLPKGLLILAFSLIIAYRNFTVERAKFARIRRHCVIGCLTPSKVVALSPCMIAVYTDMATMGIDSYPIIRIFPMPLEKTKGRRWRIGDRLATICLYQGKPEQGFWSGIIPLPVACVTDDPQADQTALDRITAEEGEDIWPALDAGLARIPTPYRPGLTWLREPTPTQAPQVWRGN